jgi:predicted O-methyltransferase YrrM
MPLLSGQDPMHVNHLRIRPARLRRKALAETHHELSATLLEKFEELVYHPGLSGNADIHYQDREVGGGVCCTPSEAMLMHHAARLCDPVAALEIGSYVGWSSAHLANALSHGRLTCVDPFLEVRADKGSGGDGASRAHARFLQNMQRAAVADKIDLIRGLSPDVIPSIAPDSGWDFIFVDGWHLHGQPLRDVTGVLRYVAAGAVLLLHDLWIVPVRDAFMHLATTGWSFHIFDTSNYLTILWRGDAPAWLADLKYIAAGEAFTLSSAAERRLNFGLDDASIDAVREAGAGSV